MGQFDWTPEIYLERIRAEVPRYDELQEQAVAAIPFPPERVLELGMGTGETTRRLIEAYPDAWVVGLDASPDMVFRARETYDDVQLARMEDPLPDGPWDLVISVLSLGDWTDEQKQALFRRVREHSRSLVIGDVFEPEQLENVIEWCGGELTWQADDLAVIEPAIGELGRLVRGAGAGRAPRRYRPQAPLPRRTPSDYRYHSATDGRPKEENLQRPARQAARHAQGGEASPQPVPALPQPAPAAPGLPDLRHLRRA